MSLEMMLNTFGIKTKRIENVKYGLDAVASGSPAEAVITTSGKTGKSITLTNRKLKLYQFDKNSM